MTLIDDTCDGCGRRFDPMGDPHLTRRPEVGEWAVYCWPCSVDDRRANLEAARDAVRARPRLRSYLDSDRRIPFNEHGLFRHYPELDVG